jgi:SWI/SNF-related matrix-associated actin-dependent regulator 1 of chromatin subfamily A
MPNPSPLVVFGFHRSVLENVREQAKILGIKTVGIRGGDDPADRQAAVDLFQQGKADLFVCPIRAGGVGINLQRASKSLVLERDWSPARDIQAQDRVHRLGQIHPVVITYMDARGTVDEHVASVVAAKKRLIDGLIDGTETEETTSQSIVEDVLTRIGRSKNVAVVTAQG